MKKRILRTTAIFRCIITMQDGFHKTVRMTVDKVAKMCSALKELRESPWLTRRYEDFFHEIGIDFRQVARCKFINERTNEVLLEI